MLSIHPILKHLKMKPGSKYTLLTLNIMKNFLIVFTIYQLSNFIIILIINMLVKVVFKQEWTSLRLSWTRTWRLRKKHAKKAQNIHKLSGVLGCGNLNLSGLFVFYSAVEPLLNIRDFTFQVGAGIDFTGYLFAGVSNRRSVSSAQLLPDLGQRVIGFLPDKIHCHTPG